MSLRQQPSSADQRNVIIATVLIAIITFVWMWQMAPEQPPPTAQEDPVTDTTVVEEPEERFEERAEVETEAERAAPLAELTPPDDPALAQAREGEERYITVENEFYRAVFSTRGATPVSFELKQYQKYDRETPVQLVDTTRAGALSLAFTTPANHNVDSRALYFEPQRAGGQPLTDEHIQVSEGGEELIFEASIGEGTLRQVYAFDPDSYEVRLRLEHENIASYVTQSGYEVVWNGGVPFSEEDAEAEAMVAGAFARSGGDIVDVRLDSEENQEARLSGQVDWTAVKNKYFTAVIMPQGSTQGAQIVGDQVMGEEAIAWEDFTTRLQVPRPVEEQFDEYTLYLGPMEYYRITSYGVGLYGMVDYGWAVFEWMTRPLAQFIFIPAIAFLSNFIANYGLIIILLAILVKLAVYPLVKTSYRSMAQMRELQPRMQEIQEEYEDNPEKQQQEMIKLYKETGVNPLGGCLPMLLQYPIIIALWQFLPNAIEIRQQSFLWATDLSVPDVILNLPFTIPLYGDFVAGFTLLMGLSMVVQMRVQMAGQAGGMGQMKALTYIFPVMIFVIFNRFASGLSLYYLTYNVVTAVQQKFINRSIEKEKEEDEQVTDANGEVKSREQLLEERRQRRREKAKSQ